MSFFELDGGNAKKAKPKAKKSTKSKAKKAPAKKSSGKKKTKKGGNFLGTVSELFAPAGWESFVTAAGLLALDRTDNFLRKSKDSKKQKGGADDTPNMEEEMTGGARKRSSSRKHRGGADHMMMEEEMTGGARKRSSSRKQRGGSDGHHTVEALDMMMGGEEPEMTGGAKKKKGSGKRKQKGGEFMNDNKKQEFLELYNKTNNERPNNNKSQNSNRRIKAILEAVGFSINQNRIREMDDAIIEARQLIKNKNNTQRVANNSGQLVANNSGQPAANQLAANNSVELSANAQRVAANAQRVAANQLAANNSVELAASNNTPSSLFGGKPKPKSKSSSKKPKAKKPKTKAKKAPKRK